MDPYADFDDRSFYGEPADPSKDKVIIDFGAYRDLFPELEVGIRDKNTGKFYRTKAIENYDYVLAEFHDLFVRRTLQEAFDAGLIPPDDNTVLGAFELGINLIGTGFRGRPLKYFEFKINTDRDSIYGEHGRSVTLTTGTTHINDKTGETGSHADEESLKLTVDYFLEARADARKKKAEEDEELRKAIAESEEKIKEMRRNNPNWGKCTRVRRR